MAGDGDTGVPGQHLVPVDSVTTTCPRVMALIGSSPRSWVANTKLAACRVSRPPSLVVRPCQPLGSRSRTPPPVSWAGLPDEPAGTVDQGICGGSGGCSVRGTIWIVPVGVGDVEMTSGSPSLGASIRPATIRTPSPTTT